MGAAKVGVVDGQGLPVTAFVSPRLTEINVFSTHSTEMGQRIRNCLFSQR